MGPAENNFCGPQKTEKPTVCTVSNTSDHSCIIVRACPASYAPLRMPTRRLDDRIRHLSMQVAGVSNQDVEPLLQDLLAAIQEKLDRLRSRAADRFLHGKPLIERRCDTTVEARPADDAS